MGIFRRFRTVFGLTALVAIAACSSWRPYQPTSTQPSQFPSAVRVTLESGDRVTLGGAFLGGDTLLYGRPGSQGDLQAFPMRNVELIETRRFSAGKTFLLAVVVLVPTGFLLFYNAVCPGLTDCN